MATVNTRRVALGAVLGGVAWTIWSTLVNTVFLGSRYAAAQKAGLLLAKPRYSFFIGYWIIILFLLSYVLAWLYASVRATRGAGPGTALTVGLLVGFAAGFPLSFSQATWGPVDRVLPLWWMLDMWVGSIVAALLAGWVYKDQPAA